MKRVFTIIAGLLLLLAFAQCTKDKEKEQNIQMTNEAVEYIEDNIQSQLELLADKDNAEILESLAEWTKGLDGVKSAAVVNGHVEINHVDGTKSRVVIIDSTIIGCEMEEFRPIRETLDESGNHDANDIVIEGTKAFIWDPFPDYFCFEDDEGTTYTEAQIIQLMLNGRLEVKYLLGGRCTVNALRNLTENAFVYLSTHGNVDAFATGETVSGSDEDKYREEMEEGKVGREYLVYKTDANGVKYKGNYYYVTDKFIEALNGRFGHSLVLNSSCYSLVENDMALCRSFMNKGVSTYFGYDNSVGLDYSYLTNSELVRNMLLGYNTGTAFNKVIRKYPYWDYKDNHDHYLFTVRYCIKGAEDLSLYEIPPVPTDGLVAYYPFNGNANDESGNGNNGILGGAGGGPTLTTDRFGNENSCYEFGGFYNPNWIDVPNSSSLHLDEAVTVSFWVQECFRGGTNGWGQYSTTDYNYGVIAKGGDGWSCPPGLWVFTNHSSENADGFVGTIVNNSVSNGNYVFSDLGPRTKEVEDCDWLHCAVVIDRNHLTFYHNAVLVMDTIVENNADFSAANNQDMHIGIEGGHFWNPRDGKLDDIRIYNRALTRAEVFALYKE